VDRGGTVVNGVYCLSLCDGGELNSQLMVISINCLVVSKPFIRSQRLVESDQCINAVKCIQWT